MYAARARPGAPVAAQITRSELTAVDSANGWHITDGDVLVERAASADLSS